MTPPHCFTEGTEILTNEGWKFFKDLTKEELMIEGLIQDEKEMYIENGNNYKDFVYIRFLKHFNYYFDLIWSLKED